jgi:hypothetical protein
MTFLAKLLLVAVLAILPAMAVEMARELQIRDGHLGEVNGRIVSQARFVNAALDRILDGPRQILVAISGVAAVRDADPEPCNTYLHGVQPSYPMYNAIGRVDASGRTICASLPIENPQALSTTYHLVKNAREFSVGGFVRSLPSGNPVVPTALPLFTPDGAFDGSINISLNLRWVSHFLSQTTLMFAVSSCRR